MVFLRMCAAERKTEVETYLSGLNSWTIRNWHTSSDVTSVARLPRPVKPFVRQTLLAETPLIAARLSRRLIDAEVHEKYPQSANRILTVTYNRLFRHVWPARPARFAA